MQQSPSWEANLFSDSQEIPRILWNPNVHYHISKCPPPVHILSHLDSVYTPTSYFLKIYLNIILSSTPGSPNGLLLSDFPIENRLYDSPLSHTRYMPNPSHSSRFYYPNNIGWGVQLIKPLIMWKYKPSNKAFSLLLLIELHSSNNTSGESHTTLDTNIELSQHTPFQWIDSDSLPALFALNLMTA
jgi:hypothetical protein